MYEDNENKDNIIQRLRCSPTVKELLDVVNEVYPNWIHNIQDNYCNDYQHLTSNWNLIASKNNTTPKKIVLVDFVSFEENYTVIQTLCEIFTTIGFVIRSKNEFIQCFICNRVIPAKHMYDLMKTSNIQGIPVEWIKKCSTC